MEKDLAERVIAYSRATGTTYRAIGEAVGLTPQQSKYVISRFVGGKVKLYPQTQQQLIELLEQNGY